MAVDFEKMSWLDIEDYNKSIQNIRHHISKYLNNDGMEHNNYYYDKDVMFDKLLNKYDGNAFDVDDAINKKEDVFKGID